MTPSKVLAADLQYATFDALVKKSGLSAEIDKAKNLTVFAPNEAAFKAYGAAATKTALANSSNAQKLVKRHLVPIRLDLSALLNQKNPLVTLGNDSLKVNFDPAGKGSEAGQLALTVGGESVTTTEVPTDSGYIHVITGVIPAT